MPVPRIRSEEEDGQRRRVVRCAIEGVLDGIVDQQESSYLVRDLEDGARGLSSLSGMYMICVRGNSHLPC